MAIGFNALPLGLLLKYNQISHPCSRGSVFSMLKPNPKVVMICGISVSDRTQLKTAEIGARPFEEGVEYA